MVELARCPVNGSRNTASVPQSAEPRATRMTGVRLSFEAEREATFHHRMREKMSRAIVALAGGVGAARFLSGLCEVVDPAEITIIGNTGDDMEWNGLSISPDLDTVAYTLAGVADEERGWGIRGDTYESLGWMSRYGMETWFKLGDRDLATHCFRTEALGRGMRLSEVTRRICEGLGVRAKLLPVTDDRLRTRVETNDGVLEFQKYF